MILDKNFQTSEDGLVFTDKEIFTIIWLSPRLIFKFLNEYKYDKFVNVLLIFAGIANGFSRASSQSMGDTMSLTSIIAISVIMGGLFGWFSYYIFAVLLSWTGDWLKSKGDTKSLLRMISYAMIPFITTMILLIPQVSLFGIAIFQSEFDVAGNGFLPVFIYYITLFIEIMLAVWTLVLLVIGISEVQKISIRKSIINLILSIFIITLPIAFIAILAFLFGDLFV